MADELTKKDLEDALGIVKKERDKFEAEGQKITADLKNYQEKTSKDLEKFEKANSDATVKWAQAEKEKAEIQTAITELKDRNGNLEKVIATFNGIKDVEKKTDIHSLVNAMILTGGWKKFISNPANEAKMKEFLINCSSVNLEKLQDVPKEGKRFIDFAVEVKAASDNILRTDIGELGGFLTPPEWAIQLNSVIFEKTPIYKFCTVKQVGSRFYHAPLRGSIPKATWAGEAESTTSATPLYRDIEITLNKLMYTVPVTWDDLNNNQYNVSQEIMDTAGEAFAMTEGEGAITGNGVKKSLGITADTNIPIFTTATKTLSWDDLLKVSGNMKIGYNPIYAFNRKTAAYLRLLKDDVGRYLWAGIFGDTSSGPGAMINGYRYSSEFIDLDDYDKAAGKPIIFADFARAYLIINQANQVVIRDEFTRKKEGIVEFTVIKWTTGMANMKEAAVVLTIKS